MSPRITEYKRDGLVFDVVDSGPEDGTPVVLLHGFPQRASDWSAVTAILNERGFRTFAPDQRGLSPRARPRGRFSYRVGQLAADIRALTDAIGVPVHLAGHDWGSMVAWSVALLYGDRVRSLTAISTGHPAAFARSLLTSSQAVRSWYFLAFQVPWIPEFLIVRRPGRRLFRHWGMPPTMYREFDREIAATGALRGGLNWYRGLVAMNPKVVWRKVMIPTTMVWTEGDPALTRAQAEGSRRHVAAEFRLEILPGSHWVLNEQPGQIARIIAERAEAA